MCALSSLSPWHVKCMDLDVRLSTGAKKAHRPPPSLPGISREGDEDVRIHSIHIHGHTHTERATVRPGDIAKFRGFGTFCLASGLLILFVARPARYACASSFVGGTINQDRVMAFSLYVSVKVLIMER